MGFNEEVGSYFRDFSRFVRSPFSYYEGVKFSDRKEQWRSVGYLSLGLLITTAILLTQLRFVPDELIGPLRGTVTKEKALFGYVVSLLFFAVVAHLGMWAARGKGRLLSTGAGLFRIQSFVFPGVTLLLALSNGVLLPIFSTYWLVIPPLGVRIFEPLQPGTPEIAFAAGFMTAQIHLALFLYATLICVLAYVHGVSKVRSGFVVAGTLVVMSLAQPLIGWLAQWLYYLFGPLVDVFLP